jgi:transaldolase
MTKLFLDSCNPEETQQVQSVIGSLQGQTTNPSLLIKNPKLQSELTGGKFTESKLLELYKEAVTNISNQIPGGSVSIEVYADKDSTVEELLKQAEEFYTWIPNAHIKFPTTQAGLASAEIFVNQGGRVNMTLVFDQAQALAIHLATINAKKKGDVFVSPFIGRLDDIGQDGLNLVRNIKKMYQQLDSKVEILAASVRTLRHFQESIDMGCDIITAPASTLINYKKGEIYNHPESEIKPTLQLIPYQELQATNWSEININHPLTESGLAKFASDWNGVLIP